MKRSTLVFTLQRLILVFTALLLLAGALLPASNVLAAPAAAPPVPKAPNGSSTDTTPTFQWTKIATAQAYHLEVRKHGVQIYVVAATNSACSGSLCSKTPATALTPGPYVFRVRAKIGGVWKGWSAFKAFNVANPGFNTNFNGSAGDWLDVHGTWTQGPATMYSEGSAGDWDTIANTNMYANFTFEAKIRRSNCLNCGTVSGLFFRGNPDSTDPTDFMWNDSFLFLYTNDGNFAIGWVQDGLFSTPSGLVMSSAIVRNSWNVLKVTANGNYLRFYINNMLVADGNFHAFGHGHVGVGFLDDVGRFDVDWATLSLSAPAGPSASAQDAGVLHLDEADAVPFDLIAP